MAFTNAEKQARHRAKQKAQIRDLELALMGKKGPFPLEAHYPRRLFAPTNGSLLAGIFDATGRPKREVCLSRHFL